MERGLHKRVESERDELLNLVPEKYMEIVMEYWRDVYEFLSSYEGEFHRLNAVRIANKKLEWYIGSKSWENLSVVKTD